MHACHIQDIFRMFSFYKSGIKSELQMPKKEENLTKANNYKENIHKKSFEDNEQ